MSSPSDKPPKPDDTVPDPELNPMSNPLLSRNMGRWAEVYFTNPPEKRTEAVQQLLRELTNEQPSQQASAAAAPAPAKKAAPPPVADKELAPCPACLHKNPAHHHFCGLCGFPLHSESQVSFPKTEDIPSSEPLRPVERTEEGWEWLREKNLAEFHATAEPTNRWKYLLPAIALILGAALLYLLLNQKVTKAKSGQTSSASAPQLPATEANTGTQQGPPVSTAPTADKPKESPVTEENSPQKQVPDVDTSTTPGARPTSQIEDGSRELLQGRRYLEGKDVPKNPAMASNWLWKAVAKQNSEAVLLLSDLYVRGDGVPKSCDQARLLLTAAVKRGYSPASEKLSALTQQSCR